MPMRRLKATAETVHFGFYDAALPPVFEVESGEEFWIATVSADPTHDVCPDWIPATIPEIFEGAPRGTGPHILTGPIAVAGAAAGDVLQIDILDIRLTQPYGYNIVSPLKGMFGSEHPTQLTTIIPIDLNTGIARVTDRVSLATAPFFGQLHAPRGARQQRGGQLFFEPGKRPAHARRGLFQILRRRAQRAAVDDGDKNFQVVRIDIHASLFPMMADGAL